MFPLDFSSSVFLSLQRPRRIVALAGPASSVLPVEIFNCTNSGKGREPAQAFPQQYRTLGCHETILSAAKQFVRRVRITNSLGNRERDLTSQRINVLICLNVCTKLRQFASHRQKVSQQGPCGQQNAAARNRYNFGEIARSKYYRMQWTIFAAFRHTPVPCWRGARPKKRCRSDTRRPPADCLQIRLSVR